MARVLVIDDEPAVGRMLTLFLKRLNHTALVALTLSEGLSAARSGGFDLVMLDLEFPTGNGLQILPDLLKAADTPEVIIITGSCDPNGARLAFEHGAWDYIQKPFCFEDVSLPVARALQYRRQKGPAEPPVALDRRGIIGYSQPILTSLDAVARAAISDASVLITGETGTGKELFARAIHANSRRSSAAFVVLDCGAIPESLAAEILFGHEKGAFTGADRRQEGVIRQAGSGTLFLDEIGDLPMTIQATLLRTLQEKRFRPIGAKSEVPVDFRLVSATNRDLDQFVAQNRFRHDLLYRIRAMQIQLPPLRERGQDVQEIAIQMTHRLGQRHQLGIKGISPDFLEAIGGHPWPGNVRELIHVLEYALSAAKNDPALFPKHLTPEYRLNRLALNTAPPLGHNEAQEAADAAGDPLPTWSAFREQAEREYLQKLMQKAGGNRSNACRLSGISQSRLYDLLGKHGLKRFRNPG